MNVLTDPRIFNYVIMSLYAANVLRWAIFGSAANAFYWLGALIITVTVTWGYQHP